MGPRFKFGKAKAKAKAKKKQPEDSYNAKFRRGDTDRLRKNEKGEEKGRFR